MSATARLSLPYIAPQQAQKQVTYNAAMALLDQLVQPAVLSRSITAPPGSPAEGDTWIVGPAATGAWAGQDGRFAAWLSGGWSFKAPAEGWFAWVIDTAELAIFQSGAWAGFVPNGAALAKFGVHATADLTNRLVVAADGSLFTHDGTSHRMKLNKATSGDTASLLLETGLSARAEIGLTGDDQLHVKVSPNGSSWFEALSIAQATGVVSLPIGQLAFPATQNPSANANTLDDYEEGTWTPAVTFGGAAVGVTYGSPSTGRYTKIGRLVIATGSLTLTSKGSSTGAAQITGLPFTALNDTILNAVAVGFASGFTSVTGAVIGLVQPNVNRVTLYQSANGAATGLSNAHFTNTSAVYFTAIFEAQ